MFQHQRWMCWGLHLFYCFRYWKREGQEDTYAEVSFCNDHIEDHGRESQFNPGYGVEQPQYCDENLYEDIPDPHLKDNQENAKRQRQILNVNGLKPHLRETNIDHEYDDHKGQHREHTESIYSNVEEGYLEPTTSANRRADATEDAQIELANAVKDHKWLVHYSKFPSAPQNSQDPLEMTEEMNDGPVYYDHVPNEGRNDVNQMVEVRGENERQLQYDQPYYSQVPREVNTYDQRVSEVRKHGKQLHDVNSNRKMIPYDQTVYSEVPNELDEVNEVGNQLTPLSSDQTYYSQVPNEVGKGNEVRNHGNQIPNDQTYYSQVPNEANEVNKAGIVENQDNVYYSEVPAENDIYYSDVSSAVYAKTNKESFNALRYKGDNHIVNGHTEGTPTWNRIADEIRGLQEDDSYDTTDVKRVNGFTNNEYNTLPASRGTSDNYNIAGDGNTALHSTDGLYSAANGTSVC